MWFFSFGLVFVQSNWVHGYSPVESGCGYSLEFSVGVCGLVLLNLTLFENKICNFPVPLFRPGFWTSYRLHTYFQSWPLESIHCTCLQTFRPKWLKSIPSFRPIIVLVYYWCFACHVMAAMLVYRNNKIFLLWDLTSILMQTIETNFLLFCTPTWRQCKPPLQLKNNTLWHYSYLYSLYGEVPQGPVVQSLINLILG